MKIETISPAVIPISAERNLKQVAGEGGSSGPAVNQSPVVSQAANLDRNLDRTTLSSNRTSLQSLASEALKQPEVRQAKVDALRQAISSGEYQVDPAKIAAAIVNSKE